MSYMLEGRTVLITGAGSGLGRAAAVLFAKEGSNLVLVDVSEEGGQGTLESIAGNRGRAVFLRGDVSDAAQVRSMVACCIDTFGRLDCAVNNAAVEGARAPTAEYQEEEWERVIDINLKGVFLGMKYQIPEMLKLGGGAIVNVGSTASLGGVAGMPAYVAAKHGVLGLTRTAAIEYGDRNIRVNAIFPGSFRTPLSERLFGAENIEQVMTAATPLRRLGSAEECAESIVWLCSARASFVTGAGLSVDGGKRAQ